MYAPMSRRCARTNSAMSRRAPRLVTMAGPFRAGMALVLSASGSSAHGRAPAREDRITAARQPEQPHDKPHPSRVSEHTHRSIDSDPECRSRSPCASVEMTVHNGSEGSNVAADGPTGATRPAPLPGAVVATWSRADGTQCDAWPAPLPQPCQLSSSPSWIAGSVPEAMSRRQRPPDTTLDDQETQRPSR